MCVTLCWTGNTTPLYTDRVLLKYGAVMGLTDDLNLVGNNFTNAATALWIAVVIMELPNSRRTLRSTHHVAIFEAAAKDSL